MPIIQTYVSRVSPQSAQIPRMPVGAAAAPAQELAGIGGVLTQIGSHLLDKLTQAENTMEIATLQRKSGKIYNATFNTLQTTTDPEIRKQVYEKGWNESVALTSKRPSVKAVWEAEKQKSKVRWDADFFDLDNKLRVQNIQSEFELNYKDLLAQGKLAEAKDLLDAGLKIGALNPVAYKHYSENMEFDSALGRSRLLIGNNNLQTAIGILSDQKFRSKLSGDQLDKADSLLRMAQQQARINTEEANKQLTDLMAQNKLSILEIQTRRNLLTDVDYQTWTKIAMNPPDKNGNVIGMAELKEAATDIWRGTITREDLDKRMRISLADPNGINKEQAAQIISAADTELKGKQAEDKRSYVRRAANVILGEYSGLLQFDALGNLTGVNLSALNDTEKEDAKYRFHFLSKYEDALRDFIAENPKVSGKEFYQYAEDLKLTYWNTKLEQMKEQVDKEKAGIVGKKTYKKGDTRIINGVTYTFDGKVWNY